MPPLGFLPLFLCIIFLHMSVTIILFAIVFAILVSVPVFVIILKLLFKMSNTLFDNSKSFKFS